MKKRTILAVAAGVAVCIAAVAAIVANNWYSDRHRPNFAADFDLYVHPGTQADSLLRYMRDSCGTLRPRSLARMFRAEFKDAEPQPGHYSIAATSSSAYAVRKIRHGWEDPVNLTLSGTMRLPGQIAKKISAQMMADSASVAAALASREFLSKFGFTPENVFAMFIPDTYNMYWTASVDDIFARQKEAYDAFWTPERKAKAAQRGLTQMEVSILASIVKGETNYEPEMPSIAGVYLNRLDKGMKLQADPTIAYCYGYTLNRILKKHLSVESPYNTYKYHGLPPAPICVPTKACLEAVLSPDKHGYLFFCASPDFNGSHRFAVTYSEHMKNARAFQKALNERAKARAGK